MEKKEIPTYVGGEKVNWKDSWSNIRSRLRSPKRVRILDVADVLEYQGCQRLMEMRNSENNNIAEEVNTFNNHFLLICA